MPERKYDFRINEAKMRRLAARVDLQFDKLCDHWGIPRITEEEVDRALAEEGVSRPVKSPPGAQGHPSTGRPAVHRQPRATRPTDEET